MTRQTDSSPGGSSDRARQPAVVYFAKAPIAGLVKTRLVPPLTAEEAAALYRAFLKQVVVAVPGARTLVYGWPEQKFDVLREALPPEVELRPQQGRDLFERMIACMEELFAEGHSPVLVRNTDSPDLQCARVEEGLAKSGDGVVVLGPDTGGGYYLVSLSAPCPDLFRGISEGGASVFAHTVCRAEALGMEVELLREERDVDTFDDLVGLWQDRLR